MYSININQIEIQILVFPLIKSKTYVKFKESHHAYLIFSVWNIRVSVNFASILGVVVLETSIENYQKSKAP